MTAGDDPRLLLLDASDNVLIVAGPVAAGERFLLGGRWITADRDLPTGHKVARTALRAGDKAVRCGMPIGSITRPVEAGRHVHTHNLQSDYIATHLRGEAEGPR